MDLQREASLGDFDWEASSTFGISIMHTSVIYGLSSISWQWQCYQTHVLPVFALYIPISMQSLQQLLGSLYRGGGLT